MTTLYDQDDEDYFAARIDLDREDRDTESAIRNIGRASRRKVDTKPYDWRIGYADQLAKHQAEAARIAAERGDA